MTPAPLAGVRVLDMTRLLPGNFAALLLVGLGAEVIKVEAPGSGDGTRYVIPQHTTGESGAHLVLNRGKRSFSVDLKSPAGREMFLRLVATAQVIVDSFRPGVFDRLGLGPEVLNAVNPTLVHVSLTAFGDDGPYATVPAHDLNSSGYAGLLSLAVDPSGGPAMPGVQMADMASAFHTALAVLAGLRVAERDGEGFVANVAMSDAAASMLTLAAGHFAVTAKAVPAPWLLTGKFACYGLYRCGDDKWITVGGLETKFFARMLELMGMSELAALQYDIERQPELRASLAAQFAKRPSSEWLSLLAFEDTCVGPVNDVAEAMADPNLRNRGIVVDALWSDGSSAPVVAAIPWLPGIGREQHLQAPALGEGTDELIARLPS